MCSSQSAAGAANSRAKANLMELLLQQLLCEATWDNTTTASAAAITGQGAVDVQTKAGKIIRLQLSSWVHFNSLSAFKLMQLGL